MIKGVSQMESDNKIETNINSMLRPEKANTPQDLYLEYRNLYRIAYQIRQQQESVMNFKNNLINKVLQIEVFEHLMQKKVNDPFQEDESSKKEEKTRKRRLADEIERSYNCPAKNCGKQYGLEGSLVQHIKTKHPEIYHSKV